MQLVHSPDDERETSKGWYWVGWDWSHSQLFATAEDARRARRQKTIKWESRG